MTRFSFKNAWRSLFAFCLAFSLALASSEAVSASVPVGSLDDFVITVQTDNAGTSTSTQFTIPTTGLGYNYNVDCNNDGTNEATGQTGDYTCDYTPLPGDEIPAADAVATYTIRIKDNSATGPGWTGFPRIIFNNGGDKLKILTIQQWGTGAWSSMAGAFYGSANLTLTATDAPDLTGVTDLSYMFYGASLFNGDLSAWNTANVTDMSFMFTGASVFNGNITTWDTSNVTDMTGMFFGATNFNQDISLWDTSKVTGMGYMFNSASAFNQDLGGWDVGALEDANSMFEYASSFDQDLGGWDVSALLYAVRMFANATLSTSNYDALLNGWNARALQSTVEFNGGNSTYCAGETARANMITADTWTITDGGTVCPLPNEPTSGLETSNDTPAFIWSKAVSAELYQLQLRNGASLVYMLWSGLDGCGEATCSITPDTILKFGAYNWRVRARISGSWGSWSSLESFRVMSAVPTIISPSGSIMDTTPRYFWTRVAEGTRYHLQVYQGDTRVLNRTVSSRRCGIVSCSITPPLGLDFADHQWRMRAEVGGVWEAWTDYTNFTVVP